MVGRCDILPGSWWSAFEMSLTHDSHSKGTAKRVYNIFSLLSLCNSNMVEEGTSNGWIMAGGCSMVTGETSICPRTGRRRREREKENKKNGRRTRRIRSPAQTRGMFEKAPPNGGVVAMLGNPTHHQQVRFLSFHPPNPSPPDMSATIGKVSASPPTRPFYIIQS